MKLSEVRKAIRAEVRRVINEVKAPKFRARYQDNNLVAAIYFSWSKAENNNPAFWSQVQKVVSMIEQQNFNLVQYIVTGNICEFEFTLSGPVGQDELDNAKSSLIDALKPLSSQFTNYDVYVVGN
jgi:hypothetical protein